MASNEVAALLERIGQEKLIPIFQKQEIHDIETIKELSAEEWNQLGITIGAKKAILKELGIRGRSESTTSGEDIETTITNRPRGATLFDDTLYVTIAQGKNIGDPSKPTAPLCVISSSFNNQQYKTNSLKKNTSDPDWKQQFTFFTSKAEGKIFIKVMEYHRFKSNSLLGECELKVAELGDGAEHDLWIPLTKEKPKKEGKGEIRIVALWTGKPKPKEDKPKEKAPKKAATEEPKKAPTSSTPATKEAPKDPGDAPKKKPAVKIEDKYEMGKIIGRGAFSVVREAIRKSNGAKYAVKCIDKKKITKKELTLLEREIDIMKRLTHPNIIQLMEVISTKEMVYLVLEYVAGGELFDAIVARGAYSEEDAAFIMKQIISAISYCHKLGIAHRDLKPENLLLLGGKDPDHVKIADFGLSKNVDDGAILQTACGTPDYVAPEVLSGEPYDLSVDIWSIGVITYVILVGFPPFWGEDQKALFEAVLNARYDFNEPEWNDVSDEAKNFISSILVLDVDKRPTADELLQHPWIVKKTAVREQKAQSKAMGDKKLSIAKFKEYNQKYKETHANPVKVQE